MTIAELVAKIKLKAEGFDKVDDMFGKLKKWAIGLATLTAAIKFGGMIQDVIDLGDHLDEMAQKSGVDVEQLQRLGYAFGQSGVSLDQLNAAFGKFGMNADKAAHGAKAQKEAFDEVGVSAKGLADGSVKLEDALGKVADKFATMEDGQEKRNLAIKLFGKAGADLIPTLNQGSGAIAQLAKEADDLGIVLDGKTAEAMGKLNDDQDRLKAGVRGLKMQIAVALLPTLQQLVKAGIAWFKANRELIKQRVAQFAKALAVVLKILAKLFGGVMDVIVGLTGGFDKLSGVMKAVTIAVGILGAAMVAAAVASAVAWLAGLWPFALLAVALFAIGLIVEDVWEAFNGGESVFKDLYNAIVEYIGQGATGVLVQAFEGWYGALKMFFDYASLSWKIFKMEVNAVVDLIKAIIEKIEQAAEAAAKAKNFLKDTAQGAGDFISGRDTSLLQPGVKSASKGAALATTPTAALTPSRVQAVVGPTPANSKHPQQRTFNANLTFNGVTGDPKEIAKVVRRTLEEYEDDKNREVAAGGNQ